MLRPSACKIRIEITEIIARISAYSTRACPSSRSARAKRADTATMYALWKITTSFLVLLRLSRSGLGPPTPLAPPCGPSFRRLPQLVARGRQRIDVSQRDPLAHVSNQDASAPAVHRLKVQSRPVEQSCLPPLGGSSLVPEDGTGNDDDAVTPVEPARAPAAEKTLGKKTVRTLLEDEESVRRQGPSPALDLSAGIDQLNQPLLRHELEPNVESDPSAQLRNLQQQPVAVLLVGKKLHAGVGHIDATYRVEGLRRIVTPQPRVGARGYGDECGQDAGDAHRDERAVQQLVAHRRGVRLEDAVERCGQQHERDQGEPDDHSHRLQSHENRHREQNLLQRPEAVAPLAHEPDGEEREQVERRCLKVRG